LFNGFAIYLIHCSNNAFSGNVLSDNMGNFKVDGIELSHFMHSIDVSNLVDGKPVYYLVNQNDLAITPATCPEIGCLALINSTDVTVEDLTLKNNGEGLLLVNTNNSRVTDNNITNNDRGVFLFSSFNNVFSGNNITNNNIGVLIEFSSSNTFHHNNIADNTRQVSSPMSGSANFWDDGHPCGGNYWGDYNGADLYSGSYQNETGSDGIGDVPYDIHGDGQDNYPLMDPYDPAIVDFRVLYYELLDQYNDLLADYENLNATYYGLLAGFDALNISYNNLEANFNSRNSTYNNLVSQYNTLQTSYYQLNSSYTALQDSYDKLQSDQEAIINELSTTRYSMYIFIAATIVFVATTAYLSLGHKKILGNKVRKEA